jgi:hypothetical protein
MFIVGWRTLLVAAIIWACWDFFHCAFHVCQDFALLNLPGAKQMMIKKVIVLMAASAFLMWEWRRAIQQR